MQNGKSVPNRMILEHFEAWPYPKELFLLFIHMSHSLVKGGSLTTNWYWLEIPMECRHCRGENGRKTSTPIKAEEVKRGHFPLGSYFTSNECMTKYVPKHTSV